MKKLYVNKSTYISQHWFKGQQYCLTTAALTVTLAVCFVRPNMCCFHCRTTIQHRCEVLATQALKLMIAASLTVCNHGHRKSWPAFSRNADEPQQ